MVAAGEVHSLGPGMLVYEVQQSCDLTYRLFDFDRVGLDGRPRELHVDKGFSVVTAPHDPAAARTAGPYHERQPGRTRSLVRCPQFRVSGGSRCTDVSRWTRGLPHHHRDRRRWDPGTAGGEVHVGLGTSVVVPAGTGPVEVEGTLMTVVTDPDPTSPDARRSEPAARSPGRATTRAPDSGPVVRWVERTSGHPGQRGRHNPARGGIPHQERQRRTRARHHPAQGAGRQAGVEHVAQPSGAA